jgi:mannose-6-phosphate isomerase-like protein (cupin superfamily)
MPLTLFVKRFAAPATWGLLALHAVALAQDHSSAAFPPVEQASFHQLMFADEDITILNNRYPPNGDAGFHTHFHDNFYVVIRHTQSSGQGLGKPLVATPAAPVGAAGYGTVGAEPRTHRIVNGDKGVAQFVVVEMLRPNPLGSAVSSREAAPQYVQIIDNPRLRAWRLTLAPGQSVPAITQASKGVQIIVRGGLLTTIRPGSPEQVLYLQAGDVSVQPAGASRALKNEGAETIELVELELK